jgi:hypothetical protein
MKELVFGIIVSSTKKSAWSNIDFDSNGSD